MEDRSCYMDSPNSSHHKEQESKGTQALMNVEGGSHLQIHG